MFPKIGVPQNGWFIMENPIKMDDLGGKPTICGNPHLGAWFMPFPVLQQGTYFVYMLSTCVVPLLRVMLSDATERRESLKDKSFRCRKREENGDFPMTWVVQGQGPCECSYWGRPKKWPKDK